MSMGSLGGSTFTVTANTNPFEAGMKRAEAGAKRTHQVITNEMGATAVDVGRKLEGVGRSVDTLNSKLGGIGRGGRGAGMGLMQLGYMVDDLQYGFRAIVNNIPQMVYMFGGSAGLAGGVGIAAVAVGQLIGHWDQLMDAMKAGWLNVPAADLERLRVRAEKAGEAFDKLMLTPSKVRAGQIKALEEAFAEADHGGPAVALKMIAEAMRQMPEGSDLNPAMTDQQKKRMAGVGTHRGALVAIGMNEKDIAKLEVEERKKVIAELDKERRERARQLIGLAASGEAGGKEKLATILMLIKQFPKTFEGFPKFVKMMAETTEEAVEHKEANKAAVRHMMAGPMLTEMMAMAAAPAPGGGGPDLSRKPGGADIRRLVARRFPHASKEQIEDLSSRMDGRGMTEGQMQAALGHVTPRKLADLTEQVRRGMMAEKDRQAAAMGLGKPRHRPGDFVDAAREEARRRLLVEGVREAERKGPAPPKKPPPDPLEERIKGMMKAAGVEGDARGAAKEMREMLRERIKAVMLERGVTEKQARQIILSERGRALQRQIGPAQSLGTDERSRQILGGGAGFGGMAALPDINKKQLEELTKIREVLSAMGGAAAGGGAVARAVPPR